MTLVFQCLVAATSLLALLVATWLLQNGAAALRRPARWVQVLARGAQDRSALRAVTLIAGALLVTVAPSIYGAGGAARAVAGFGVLLLAPGAVVIPFLLLRDPLTELALAVAISMAVLVLGSQILLALHLWRPLAAFQIVLLLTAPALTLHAALTAGLWRLGRSPGFGRSEVVGSHARA